MVKTLLLNLTIAIAYVLASKLGFYLAFLNTQVSPIWPPEGVGFFVMARFGLKAVPGVFLGAFLANFLNNPHLPTALIIGIGNTASSYINIYILRKITEHSDPLFNMRALFNFFIFGTIPGSLISAALGVGSLHLFDFVPSEAFLNVFFTWFAGEMQGFLIVGPLFIVFSRGENYKVLSSGKIIEFIVSIFITIILTWTVFTSTDPLLFFPFLFTIYLSIRFRNLGAVSGTAIISIIAVYHTINGAGPFSAFSNRVQSLNNTLIFLDIFLFTKVIMAYFVVVLLNERDEKNRHLLLIQMNANLELEKKVRERTKIIEEQNKEFQYQIKMARAIQTSLLPSNIPKLEKCDISYQYFPMMEIGGDFLDVKHSAENNILSIFICDVSGHGIASAFVATMVKMGLEEWYKEPLDVVGASEKAHQNLSRYLDKNFITATFASIELNKNRMFYTTAGHLPILVVHKDGNFSELNPKGRVIFSFAKPDCELGIYEIQEGDTIVFYTDGISEARSELVSEEYFGINQIIEEISNNQYLSSSELSLNIINKVMEYSGGSDKIQDDLTLMILKYKK